MAVSFQTVCCQVNLPTNCHEALVVSREKKIPNQVTKSMKQIVGGKPTLKFNQPAQRLEKASLDRFTNRQYGTGRLLKVWIIPYLTPWAEPKTSWGFSPSWKHHIFSGGLNLPSHIFCLAFMSKLLFFFFRLRLLSLGFSAIARPKRKSHPLHHWIYMWRSQILCEIPAFSGHTC